MPNVSIDITRYWYTFYLSIMLDKKQFLQLTETRQNSANLKPREEIKKEFGKQQKCS